MSNITKITVTRALAELKLLDSRIRKTVLSEQFITYSVNNVNNAKNFNALAAITSINDLVNYRSKLKLAIMNSNTTTFVTINNVTMTVLEAIELKESINYKKLLLDVLKSQRTNVRASINSINDNVNSRLDKLLEANFGKDSKTKSTEYEDISKPFLAKNEATEVDTIGIDAMITNLTAEIDTFESTVDFVLSESNATTFIEVA